MREIKQTQKRLAAVQKVHLQEEPLVYLYITRAAVTITIILLFIIAIFH